MFHIKHQNVLFSRYKKDNAIYIAKIAPLSKLPATGRDKPRRGGDSLEPQKMPSASRRKILAAAAALPGTMVAARALGHVTPSADIASFSKDTREPDTIVPLWPAGSMPGGPVPAVTEAVDDQWDNAGLRYRVAEHVTRPTIAYFAASNPTGAAVLIIPGGGYSRVGIDREGYESARWMNALGVAAFVLRYRLPADRWGDGPVVALQDAQRAMRLIRAGGAGRWKVDPKRVTVMGGSAGGHLALCLSTKVYDRTYSELDAADHLLTRPDGAILLYPVVTLGAGTHVGSRMALLGPNPRPRPLRNGPSTRAYRGSPRRSCWCMRCMTGWCRWTIRWRCSRRCGPRAGRSTCICSRRARMVWA
jgi:acetyl esterase/lipase